jgi:hypothetical protein
VGKLNNRGWVLGERHKTPNILPSIIMDINGASPDISPPSKLPYNFLINNGDRMRLELK